MMLCTFIGEEGEEEVQERGLFDKRLGYKGIGMDRCLGGGRKEGRNRRTWTRIDPMNYESGWR